MSKFAEQHDSSLKHIFQISLDKYEQEVMKVFKCDSQWQICLYDFTYKNKIPQFLCFRSTSDPPNFINNYFSVESFSSSPSPPKYKHTLVTQSVTSLKSLHGSTEGLLIERGSHECCKHPAFQRNFAHFFNTSDSELFANPYLTFQINSDTKARQSLSDFMRVIATS